MPSPREEVSDRIADLNQMLASHAGGVQFEGLSKDGEVSLSFTGMCTGCGYRAVTMAAIIRPALTDIAGVSDVEAPGTRVSDVALRRLSAAGVSPK